MPTLGDRPLKRIKTESRAQSARKVDAIVAADRRAQWRLAQAEFVRAFEGSVSAAQRALGEAILEGRFAEFADVLAEIQAAPANGILTTIPSRSTIKRWRRLPAAEVTIEGLRDGARSGRPRKHWDPILRAELDRKVAEDGVRNVNELHRHLKRFAQQRGLAAPNNYQVRTRLAEIPQVARVVAAFGRRAGIADAIVHGTVPADYPHQMWTMDEMTYPVWVKAYDPVVGAVIAQQMEICFAVDNCCGVVPTYYVVNPLTRGVLRGVDRWDVIATAVGGMLPELAPPACQAFSGYIPKVIRWDRANAHKELQSRLLRIGVDVPDMPGDSPWSRGLVERTVGILKNAATRLKGYVGLYEVAEHRAAGDERATLRAAGDTTTRLREKTSILIAELYTIEEFTEQFDAIVREFNETLIHTEWRMPRAMRYLEQLRPGELRSGRDAISLLESSRHVVKKDGIVLSHHAFAAASPTMAFFKGEMVDVRADPALRGIYVADREKTYHFMPRKKDQAKRLDAATVSKAMYQAVSVYDKISKAARQQLRDAATSIESGEVADAVAKLGLNLRREVAARHRDDELRRAAADASADTSAASGSGRATGARPSTDTPVDVQTALNPSPESSGGEDSSDDVLELLDDIEANRIRLGLDDAKEGPKSASTARAAQHAKPLSPLHAPPPALERPAVVLPINRASPERLRARAPAPNTAVPLTTGRVRRGLVRRPPT